ncbi:hypothetical protein VTJ04DRAFT_422 [Mycothermus thermophilus]|uniref:uncharacterized protein n=1 Tax=Humicola insolens TaxID=85995 RepID=UPI00374327A4
MASPYQTYPGILTTVYDGNTTAHAMRCPSYVNPDHLSFLVQKCTKVTDLLDCAHFSNYPNDPFDFASLPPKSLPMMPDDAPVAV